MAPDGQNADRSVDPNPERQAVTRAPVMRDRSCDASSIPPEALAIEARAAADFLKALGHDGRLMMLYHLCERDHTVTELEQLIMSRQAAVSQQLARLRHEKLVTTRRDGNQIIYSLADNRVREMVEMIHRLFRR
ncbi:metalloregulator ArsR/SmtB family transcription factor [Pararhodobacter zhoushanensis]|uniref:ArsR/SmtB family transcription factor n=1 Tax=Pararhodobacter zhoushanensis TaxID=2479545 RepID=UPI00319EAC98